MKRLLFLPALLVAGCLARTPPEPVFRFDPGALDAEQALEEVRRFVALGARDAGTPGAETAAHYLHARLTELGLEATMDVFTDASPRGPTVFRNVEARIPGPGKGLIILGSHYDTKAGIGEGFEGANDSGSSTGLLLELARVMQTQAGPDYDGPEIRFVFFDAEECMVRYGPRDGFQGSKRYARSLVKDGRKDDVLGVIVLDMVGDKDLTVSLPRDTTPALLKRVLAAAEEEGVRSKFSLDPRRIGDDHTSFQNLGMPVVDIIDFYYGSAPKRNDYWHTPEDRMDKISAESLGIVGRVTLRTVNRLLDGRD